MITTPQPPVRRTWITPMSQRRHAKWFTRQDAGGSWRACCTCGWQVPCNTRRSARDEARRHRTLKPERRVLRAFTDEVLVRLHPTSGRPMMMNHPEKGWASLGFFWTWAQIHHLTGWTVTRRHHDADSTGFWLTRDR